MDNYFELICFLTHKKASLDPKGAKRAKSEIQTKENKTHKTKITIEDISQEPIIDPTAQYNLIQQIIQADISDPLLLGKFRFFSLNL